MAGGSARKSCEGNGALFGKTQEPAYLDDALTALGGALEEYRKGKAAASIERAGRLRKQILAAKGRL